MNNELVKNIIGTAKNTEPMPLLFVGHGSPMNAIEENEFVDSWRNLGKSIPKPDAILCISAHWETSGTYVTAMRNPPTIHDFGGFPAELYKVQYPSQGSPELAFDVKRIIKSVNVGLDEKWGLDHGAWSVIRNMYPEADVPVIEMSMDWHKSPQAHYDLAKELAPLRERGVLIIGSGNIVHNLRMIAWDHAEDPEFGFDWALTANEIFKKLIISNNHKELINYTGLGSEVKLAVPTPDHFLPLLYTLALINKNEPLSFFNDKAVMGSLTMTSLRIG
jgi:4,5-DOPA dioxygenase extradiol